MKKRLTHGTPAREPAAQDAASPYVAQPKRVGDLPLEYQASFYAKNEKLRRAKKEEKKRRELLALKQALKDLKEKLRASPAGAPQAQLKDKIAAYESSIKKAPRPKRKWSPVLPGSFESKR